VRVEAGLGGLKEERDLWCGAGDPKPGGKGLRSRACGRRPSGGVGEGRQWSGRQPAATAGGDSGVLASVCERGERDELTKYSLCS
jgi:hypothetical protein